MVSDETKVIDDLIILGRAAPEPISDGRTTVCVGGWSDTEGWVRIYPTRRGMSQLRRWNVVSVPVDPANHHDNRPESYKIAGSKADWDILPDKVELVDRLELEERIQLTDELSGDCTARLNDNKISLGMVDPVRIQSWFLDPTANPGAQLDLAMNERKGKSDYSQKLYLRYRCRGCEQQSIHEQHCIEWGVYKYWDKNDDPEGVIDALRLNDDSYKHYFFVGNLNHHRTSYIIISILRFKKSDMLRAGVSIEEQSSITSFV